MPKKNPQLAIEIGKRIIKERKSLGWTQEDLAECSGLSQQFLACVERGSKGLGAESIIKICQALGISTDYLLTGALSKEEYDKFGQMLSKLNEVQRESALEIIKMLLIACGH